MARFDKWRGNAIKGVDDTKDHLQKFADTCANDLKQSTQMTADLLADAISGEVTLGQILSGVFILGFRFWHAPFRLLSPVASATRALLAAPPPS
jgi:hypothetical protein